MSSNKSRTAVFKNVQTPAQKYGSVKIPPAKILTQIEPKKHEIEFSIAVKKLPNGTFTKSVVGKLVKKPVEKFVEKPVEKPVEKVILESIEKPDKKPDKKPDEKPIEEVILEPVILELEKVNELNSSNIIIDTN